MFWVCVCSLRYPACNAHAPYCHLWPTDSKILFHIISQTALFWKERCWTQNVCFDFLRKFVLKNSLFWEELSEMWSEMCVGLHVQCSAHILLDFNETYIFRHVFENYSNIKYHENLSSGSRVVPCGQTDRQTDVKKLIVAFRNFLNAPKNQSVNVV
jgi:hypothetical protein